MTGLGPRYATDEPPKGERRRLLDRTPHAASVLDVGCWAGSNGAYLQRTRRAVVDGVEPDDAMASRAAKIYREVHTCRIEQALSGPLAERSDAYDVVLLMDVLEHLVDPAGVLRGCAQLLANDGRLLLSLPNVAHWSVRKSLLAGRWQYTDSGILDRTHLRFFTFTSARRLGESAGLRVTWCSASLDRPPLIPLPERFHRVLRPWPGLFAAQILLELRR